MHSFLPSPTPNYATSHSAVSGVMFFDKNTSISTNVGFKLARRLLTISPALENSRSEGRELVEIPKYLSARSTTLGYLAHAISVRCKQTPYLKVWGVETTRSVYTELKVTLISRFQATQTGIESGTRVPGYPFRAVAGSVPGRTLGIEPARCRLQDRYCAARVRCMPVSLSTALLLSL